MKHTFIYISLCSVLLFLGGCSNESEIDNRVDNRRTPLTIRAVASHFENLPASEELSTRTPNEDGLNTSFQTGDAIGLFAIKDNAIVDGINNTRLTYSETSGSTGTWTPADPNTILYYYAGVTYIAYYPYKNGITITPSQATNTIIASLVSNSSLQPLTDQSSADGSLANYTASDLMIASGSPSADADNPAKQILNLNFTHQFALLVLKPQTYSAATNTTSMDMNACDVILNSYTPCRMTDGSFRAIIVPGKTSAPITGEYKTSDGITTAANKTIVFSGNESSFAAGYCYTLEVKSRFKGK
ncbi:fimbrillin family protein [Parabacteroides sp.]